MVKRIISLIDLKPKNLKNFLTGLCFLGLFTLLIVIESTGISNKFDLLTTSFLQQITPRFLDTPLSIFSILGSIEVTTFFLAIIVLLIFRKNKIILPSLGLFGVVMIFELIGKLFVYHPGPPKMFFRYDLPFSTPEYINTSYSFPSGHVGRTSFLFVVALLLILKYTKSKQKRFFLVTLLILFLIIMAFSRVYLGEHWASDVLGGLLLGSAMGFFAMVYY